MGATPIVAVAAVARTAVRPVDGELAGWSPVELAGVVGREVLERAGLGAGDLDEVVVGCADPVGACGADAARAIALAAGWPDSVGGMVVDRGETSGLAAVQVAAAAIRAGQARTVLVVGLGLCSVVPPGAAALNRAYGAPWGGVAERFAEAGGLLPGPRLSERAALAAGIDRATLDAAAEESRRRRTQSTESRPSREPGEPGGSGQPREPGEPRQPGEPGGSGQPREPGEPGGSGQPREPGEPGGSGQPREPGEPGGSGQPREPGEPGGSGQPREPGEPGGSGQPREPGEPGGSGQPREPGEPRQPREPGGSGQPREPGEPRQPGEPGEPGGSGQPREPGEPRQPGEPGESGESGEPGAASAIVAVAARPGDAAGRGVYPGDPVPADVVRAWGDAAELPPAFDDEGLLTAATFAPPADCVAAVLLQAFEGRPESRSGSHPARQETTTTDASTAETPAASRSDSGSGEAWGPGSALAMVVGTGRAAGDPFDPTGNVAEAVDRALAEAGTGLDGVDSIAVVEHDAATVLLVAQGLGVDAGRINRAGGAAATGNPGAAEELRLITDGLAVTGSLLLTISAGPTGSAAIMWRKDI